MFVHKLCKFIRSFFFLGENGQGPGELAALVSVRQREINVAGKGTIGASGGGGGPCEPR